MFMFTVNNKDTRTGSSLLGRIISQTKPLKIKSFFPFNFAITKIGVAIRLAEDRTRREAYSFNYPLVFKIN